MKFFAKKAGKLTAYTGLVCTLSSTIVAQVQAVEANSINTATIMASSASTSCASYEPVGVCYWLKCTYWKCSVKTSVKVHHFIPEMIVSTFNHDGQNPWTEMNFVSKVLPGSAGGAYGHRPTEAKKSAQERFKNAEAYGHPGGLVFQMIGSMGYSCESQTTPYMPYFLSAVDYLQWNPGWMNLEALFPESLISGNRDVRSGIQTWGNLYPRMGLVTQRHDYKASAVIAQRVADIVSRTGQLHFYQSASQSGGQGKWYPKEVIEGDSKTHRWQMLSPKREQSCKVFPHDSWDGSVLDTHSDRLSNTENYSWALWRPYACCKKEGQVFLGNTDWKSTHTH